MGTSIAGIEVITKMFFIIFMNEFGIKLIGVKKMVVVILEILKPYQHNKLQ